MSAAESLRRDASRVPMSSGVIYIHSAAPALCPHVAWGLEGVLGVPADLEWRSQPLEHRAVRTEINWVGPQGTGAAIASALRGWDSLRYEITENPSPGADGSRWSFTPALGLHHTWTSASGDTVVNEDRVRHAVAQAQGDPMVFADLMDTLLGARWDEELEPYRHAGENAPVRWLHKVG